MSNVLAQIKPYQVEVTEIETKIKKIIKKLVDKALFKGFTVTVSAKTATVHLGKNLILFNFKCPENTQDSLQIWLMNKELEKAQMALNLANNA